MCLVIEKPKILPYKGYKVYRIDQRNLPELGLRPIYWNALELAGVYKPNLEIVSNRKNNTPSNASSTTTDLFPREVIDGRVGYGIHVFNCLKDARKLARKESFAGAVVIVKVLCAPVDFIAKGVWSDDDVVKCRVYDKVTITDLCEAYYRGLRHHETFVYNEPMSKCV